jgi:hypothetical protein
MQSELVVAFRKDFLDSARPRFLPAAWDVHHSVRRGFGEHSVYAGGGDAGSVALGRAAEDGAAPGGAAGGTHKPDAGEDGAEDDGASEVTSARAAGAAVSASASWGGKERFSAGSFEQPASSSAASAAARALE